MTLLLTGHLSGAGLFSGAGRPEEAARGAEGDAMGSGNRSKQSPTRTRRGTPVRLLDDVTASAAALLDRVRRRAPLIHNITNLVAMESSANILLALGASPVMAHAGSEVEEMASRADALVLNIGTLDERWVESMVLAAAAADAKGIPVVLDPVGAGATAMRTRAARRILRDARVSVVRCNASELLAVVSGHAKTRGVDSADRVTARVRRAADALARERGCVVAVSGERDLVTDGRRAFCIGNGHPAMTRVTGIGCGLSAATAAFCAVADGDFTIAAAAAFGVYGICGQTAAKTSAGPGSFPAAFIDALHAVGEAEIRRHLAVEPARRQELRGGETAGTGMPVS